MAVVSADELHSVCAEFQQNFASLSIRYNNLQLELDAERVAKANVLRQMEALQSQADKLMTTLREVKQEANETIEYREKYRAAAVTVEHLKGRLETARRGVADTVVEHDQLTEQLRGQIQDLLQRIEVSADGRQLSELRSQVHELEERGALMSGQLIEERERHAQQQITSNSALRELSARNVELEQRYRQMESEITQMRSAVRRSMDLQNDAAIQREKSILEARAAQQDAAAARRQFDEAGERIVALQTRHEKEIEDIRSTFDAEKSATLLRLSQAVSERNDAVAARELEEERHHALQRTVQKKISASRDHLGEEIDSLHKRLADERDEKLKGQVRCRLLEQQLVELQRTNNTLESRVAQLDQEKAVLRGQTEKAVQQEAWYQAERDHSLAQLQAQKATTEELKGVVKTVEQLTLDNDKLKLALKYKDSEVSEAKQQVEHAIHQLRATEESADKRCMALHKQAKILKKQLNDEVLRADAQRKKLVATIMAKETELRAKYKSVGGEALRTVFDINAGNIIAPAGKADLLHTVPTRGSPPAFDALELLRPLGDQANVLAAQLDNLTHRRSPPSGALAAVNPLQDP